MIWNNIYFLYYSTISIYSYVAKTALPHSPIRSVNVTTCNTGICKKYNVSGCPWSQWEGNTKKHTIRTLLLVR